MDRRVVLAGLAAAAAAPALAQTRETPSPMPPPRTETPSSGGMSSGTGQMGQADMRYIQDTLRIGMLALESSRLALQKARHQDLKQFAQFETDEQETLSEVLRSMLQPAATAATGSPMQMDGKGGEMMQRLQAAQAGPDFDQLYNQGQLQGHRDLLQVQGRYLQSHPQNRDLANVAKLASSRIREHITLLEDMQGKLR